MQTVTQFRSEAGNVFNSEMDAHKDDLRHVLAQLADNVAVANKIVEALTPETRKALLIAVGALATQDNEPELPMHQSVGRATTNALRAVTRDDW